MTIAKLTDAMRMQGVKIMTYNTPELLLVGAAQNFVLGIHNVKGSGENVDDCSAPILTYEVFAQDPECDW